MKFSTKVFNVLVLSVLVTVCTAGKAFAADDALLKMLPGDCTFCVRINDLNGSLAKVDQYLTGVAPIGTAMMVNMQLANILGDPMMTGIEMNGTFALVGLSDTSVGLLVPITNYGDFVKTNPNCNETEMAGIALLSSPNSPMGAFAITEIAGGKYAVVVPESEKGKLTDIKTALTNLSASLAAKLNAEQAKASAAAPVWAYVNLASLYKQFSPMVLAGMEKAQQEMASPKMSGPMGEFAAIYIKMYLEMFKEFGGDADSATLALTPETATLTADVSLRAKDGSELAQMLVANPKANGDFAYTGYLDNANAINGLMKINPSNLIKMYDKFFDILEKSNDDLKLTEQVATMKDLTHKMLPAMGDEVAFSFSYAAGKPPFKMREVFAVKDMAAMQSLTKDCMDLAGGFYATMGLPMNFEYKPNTSTYKNATIDKIMIAFPPSDDPNDPMGEMIEKLYGGDLTYTLARSDNSYFVTMGENNEADVKALIDQDAAAAATGETKAAMDLLKDTPYNDFVCSVNAIKLMTGLGDMMKNMSPMMQPNCQGDPMPMPDFFGGLDIPSQSSLAIGGKTANGQIGIRVVLPKQHLMEIFGAVMQIQMKMMPTQQPAPAAATSDISN